MIILVIQNRDILNQLCVYSKIPTKTSKSKIYSNRLDLRKNLANFIKNDPEFRIAQVGLEQENYNLVIYNRVAKCGSTTTRYILRNLY